MADEIEHEPARRPEDLSDFFLKRANAGDVGQRPAIVNGDIALTTTRLPGGGATTEIARRQPDGSWRWVIDQPSILS